MALTPGQSISGYEILGSLGAGGMGEVYRARDTRLDREVAIKVLPAAWFEDREHGQRFEREARTLASLNHPNVAQVYTFDEAEGIRLLVLELVEGEDLSARIERGPLTPEETVAVCGQVAEGLEAAHEAGVIHRDLKPANVRITPQETVKVLDFGLAKFSRPRGGSGLALAASSFETVDDGLKGTPAYMSPEQIRARPVDRRTDIWAFGCLLYECLAGRPPFVGDTVADTLAAVMQAQPDLSLLPSRTPPHLRRLIERCLDPDPRMRLRDIGEARIALARGTSSDAAAAPRAATRVRGWAGIGALLVIAAVAWRELVTDRHTPGEFARRWEQASFTSITDFPGAEYDAVISRDGKSVAFVSDHGGELDVWLMQPGTGGLENLTNGRRKTWFPRVRNLGFDPDGTRIWLGGPGGEERIGSIPLLGGEWRPILVKGAVNVDWSPDGTKLAYHVLESGDPLWIADADGGNARLLVTHDLGLHQHFETWSLDGQWIFISRGLPSTLDMNLWRIRVDGNGLEQLTADKKDLAYPVQVDEHTVLYVARASNGGGPWLWALDLRTQSSRRVSTGISQYLSIGGSQDRGRLVATVAQPRAHLWRVAIPSEGTAGEEDAERVPGLDVVQAEAPRLHGDRLFFLSRSGAGDAIAVYDGSRRTEILRCAESPLLFSPAVSPDGKALAVALQHGDRVRLCVADVAGSVPRVVSGDVRIVGAADWSPDGDWIAVGGESDEGPGLFLFRPDGGEQRRLADGQTLNPVWSPDGEIIAYCGPQVGWWLPIRAVRVADGSHLELGDLNVIREGERIRFHPDGRGLVYMHGRRTGQDFRLFDLETKTDRLVAHFDDREELRAFDIDPTGSYIVFDRLHRNSDVVLIDLPPADG